MERRDLRPYADYHVHLLGPFALPLPDPLPAEVAVPADIRKLLDARAALSGSVRTASQLREVFTPDAQLLNSHVDPTGWLFGEAWFVRYLNLDTPGRLRFACVAPAARATAVQVAHLAGNDPGVTPPAGTRAYPVRLGQPAGRRGGQPALVRAAAVGL